MKPNKIYIMIDPRDNQIRYVGKTNQALSARLRSHMNDKSACHKVHWLQKLKAEGVEPEIIVIEEITGAWPWAESERFWIKRIREMGHNLTNNTSGGDGVPDLPAESRERIRQASIGRRHTAESLVKIGAASRGRRKTEEEKRYMSNIMKGRVISWGDKISVSVRKLDTDQVRAIELRLLNGEKVQDIAREFKMHRTSISKIKKGTYYD